MAVQVLTISPKGEEGLEDDEIRKGIIRHRYWLRPDLQLIFDMPDDFTMSDADRMAQFFRACVLPTIK